MTCNITMDICQNLGVLPSKRCSRLEQSQHEILHNLL